MDNTIKQSVTLDCSEPIYNSTVRVYIGLDKALLAKELNKEYPENCFLYPDWCDAFHVSIPQTRKHYIWLETYNPLDSNDIATLAHEVIHYAMSVLNSAGIPVDKDHDEALTHLFYYTFNYLLLELGKANGSGRKTSKVQVP